MTNRPIYQPTVQVVSSAQQAALLVADMISDIVARQPTVTLGLATGGTPIPVYEELVKRHQQGQLDLSRATSFNLDEYIGLSPAHPQSYQCFMDENLFRHVNLPADRVHLPNGLAKDANEHARAYDESIQSHGGIDWQLLGIGSNGHIAFNEPGSSVNSRTRVVDLTENTIAANARFFDHADQVPRTAISMGIGTILDAREIILLATGESKADAVVRAVEGRPDESSPASLLQHHSAVTFVLDSAAAAKLSS